MAQACDKYSKTALMGKSSVLNPKEIGTKKDFIRLSHLERSCSKKRYFMTITKKVREPEVEIGFASDDGKL